MSLLEFEKYSVEFRKKTRVSHEDAKISDGRYNGVMVTAPSGSTVTVRDEPHNVLGSNRKSVSLSPKTGRRYIFTSGLTTPEILIEMLLFTVFRPLYGRCVTSPATCGDDDTRTSPITSSVEDFIIRIITMSIVKPPATRKYVENAFLTLSAFSRIEELRFSLNF